MRPSWADCIAEPRTLQTKRTLEENCPSSLIHIGPNWPSFHSLGQGGSVPEGSPKGAEGWRLSLRAPREGLCKA